MQKITSKSDAFKACWKYVKQLIDGCRKYGWTLRKLFNRHIGSFMRKFYQYANGTKSIADKAAYAFYNKKSSFGNFTND